MIEQALRTMRLHNGAGSSPFSLAGSALAGASVVALLLGTCGRHQEDKTPEQVSKSRPNRTKDSMPRSVPEFDNPQEAVGVDDAAGAKLERSDPGYAFETPLKLAALLASAELTANTSPEDVDNLPDAFAPYWCTWIGIHVYQVCYTSRTSCTTSIDELASSGSRLLTENIHCVPYRPKGGTPVSKLTCLCPVEKFQDRDIVGDCDFEVSGGAVEVAVPEGVGTGVFASLSGDIELATQERSTSRNLDDSPRTLILEPRAEPYNLSWRYNSRIDGVDTHQIADSLATSSYSAEAWVESRDGKRIATYVSSCTATP